MPGTRSASIKLELCSAKEMLRSSCRLRSVLVCLKSHGNKHKPSPLFSHTSALRRTAHTKSVQIAGVKCSRYNNRPHLREPSTSRPLLYVESRLEVLGQ
jgi:hypothetical protein